MHIMHKGFFFLKIVARGQAMCAFQGNWKKITVTSELKTHQKIFPVNNTKRNLKRIVPKTNLNYKNLKEKLQNKKQTTKKREREKGKEKEKKGKERKGKERKGKERKGKERKERKRTSEESSELQQETGKGTMVQKCKQRRKHCGERQ
jgi:hypothetical protein